MGALSDLLQDPSKRRVIVQDGVRVIEQEVADKRGMTGLAVKGAFKAVNKVRKGFVPRALDHLMPEFAAQIDPYYDAWKAAGEGSLEQYFVANGRQIAQSLLSITDARARGADHRTVAKAYEKLRPQGIEHTIAAMPRLAGLVQRHVGG